MKATLKCTYIFSPTASLITPPATVEDFSKLSWYDYGINIGINSQENTIAITTTTNVFML